MDEHCIVRQRVGPLVKAFAKERIAMDIERYGDCKVVKIESDQEYGQIKLGGDRG